MQTIETGCFPRGITVGPDDATLYLTNFSSDSLQVIQTSKISFTMNSQTINEGAAVTVALNLSRPLSYSISVPLNVSGSATRDGDYFLTNPTITIAAGSTSGFITINTVNDQCKEENEEITLSLGEFTGFAPGSIVSQSIILNQDLTDKNLCVDGHIYNANGSPVVNRPVVFYTINESIMRYGYTDANGYFIARTPNGVSTNVPPETYLFWANELDSMINWSLSIPSNRIINVIDTSVGNLKYILN